MSVFDYPIIMQTPMVIATNKELKTETRRLRGLNDINISPDSWKFEGILLDRPIALASFYNEIRKVRKIIKSPYGKPGDRLWVRETWMKSPNAHLFADDKYRYKSSSSDQFINEWPGYWKPSIHMPKAACKTFLRNEDICVDRLHNITEESCLKEGILFYDDEVFGRRYKDYIANASGYGHPDYDYPTVSSAKESFISLWNSINAKKNNPIPWSVNPWVWVIKYSLIKN